MMKNILLVAGLAGFLCAPAFAQSEGRFDIGVKAGGGNYTAQGLDNRGFGNVGVEACAFCAGHFGLFGEYSHWFSDGSAKAGTITSAELGGFGVRFQGTRRVRPFFDFGLAVGDDTFPTSSPFNTQIIGEKSHATAGIVLGGGVTIPFNKHFYVRPQVRFYGMEGRHAAATAQVGFGWRF